MASERNIALAAELFEQLADQARSEGKTPDELAEEAARNLLSARKLQAFVGRNRRDAEALGLTEADVPRLIGEYRRERRNR